MSKRNITMKDIAKAANVSVATVSYVLNYSKKEKISHETRIRVFEAAKELKYTPNMAAKALAGKNLRRQIGIMVNLSSKNKQSKLCCYYEMINALQRCIHRYGYDAVLLSSKVLDEEEDVVPYRTLAGVFLIDVEDGKLPVITKDIYVPLVIINGKYDIDLFYKVNTNYKEVINKARNILGEDLYVIMEDFCNSLHKEEISKQFKDEDIFINKQGSNLAEFLISQKDKKGLVFGEVLGMQVEHLVDNRNIVVVTSIEKSTMLLPDTKRIIISNKEKAETSMKIMDQLVSFEYNYNSNKIVYINPVD